jgi:hypothetical protein
MSNAAPSGMVKCLTPPDVYLPQPSDMPEGGHSNQRVSVMIGHLCCRSRQRQKIEQIAANQIPKVTADGMYECTLPNQNTDFDVLVQGSLSEIRRRYERRLAVGDNGLRMENAGGSFGVPSLNWIFFI